VKDLLRKYPQWSHDCIAVVGSVSSKTVTEPKAKSALVWMLGEYAYDMPDAPYILEGFVENWIEEDSAEVYLLSCSSNESYQFGLVLVSSFNYPYMYFLLSLRCC
jgi:hypothetical protein